MKKSLLVLVAGLAGWLSPSGIVAAAGLRAGVAKVDLTNPRAERVNDPCYAKVLVLERDGVRAALVTIDAVAIGELGAIRNTFLEKVRTALAADPGIPADHLIVNASHCHGMVRGDCEPLVIQAVREAWNGLTPVKVGVGVGSESRISENRRLVMKDGRQIDMRRAYALPKDDDVASVGPIDPQIGLLRLDRADGRPLAVVYQFACHPIMNPPSKGSSADFPGVASGVVEETLGSGAMALFVQGCGGDINPVRYKEATRPPDAEPLGQRLGLSVLRGMRGITASDADTLVARRRTLSLPRAADYNVRIAAIEAEQARLLRALKPTNINFKTFLPLLIQQRMDPEHPSAHAQAYLHDALETRDDLSRLDAENRAQVDSYLANIQVMEELTRLNTNLDLLKRHRAEAASGARTIDVEVCAVRIGDFKLVTFPGELTVEIGLRLKAAARDPHTFVSGYTNGYIYYTPTVAQRNNTGYAQEDCDCLVAPEWQALFESTALELLRGL